MSYFEIRVSKGDVEEDGNPEIFVEFYYQKDWDNEKTLDPSLKSASVISSSKHNGVYDLVTDKSDLNGDGKSDTADNQILLDLANAFAKIDPESFKD